MQSSERVEDEVKTVADAIRENDRFLVVTHENPDGDALGSMLAMALGLRAPRKDVVMYLSGSAPTPAEYRFLDLDDVRRELPDDLEERVLLAVDCANDRRIGEENTGVDRTTLVLTIDHHNANSEFGDVNFIEPDASSTPEIVPDIP